MYIRENVTRIYAINACTHLCKCPLIIIVSMCVQDMNTKISPLSKLAKDCYVILYTPDPLDLILHGFIVFYLYVKINFYIF